MNLPIRLLPGAGESFGSYLRRTAHALGTTPRMLAFSLDLTPGETNSLLLDPGTTHRIAERLGLRAGEIDDLHATRWHPTVLNLRLLGHPQRLHRPWIDNLNTRFCPWCLDENGYWRLDWRLPWICTCDDHEIWLHDHCPHCGSTQRDDAWAARATTPDSCLSCAKSLTEATPEEADLDARRRTYAAQRLLAEEDSTIAGYPVSAGTALRGWRQSNAIHRALQRPKRRDPVEHWTAQAADHALELAWPLISAPDPETAAAVVRRWMLAYQRPWPFSTERVSTFILPLRHTLDDVRAIWGPRDPRSPFR